MLEIKNISKSYRTDQLVQHALHSISLTFRKNEFVAILGPSGSGKTTLLNIIGGLDHYDNGDLIINSKSTKKFKNEDWDAYRNSCIGFIFQSYNLIGHLSILDNVMMSMTLSNRSLKSRRAKAIKVLEQVGLKAHYKKRPNQLSGGQMQRVAIARALVNDPDIILADEPTGALDSKTSLQIMELIKQIAKDKLVIMVTHNQQLADQYASRVIKLSDGKVIEDSNPVDTSEENKQFKIRKTAMKFRTALKLSFNNIRTKKGRTILTAFASSIGIIGIALILSLSNGFHKQVKKYEQGVLSAMPIIISNQSMNMDESTMKQLTGDNLEKYPDSQYVIAKQNNMQLLIRTNNITKDYIEYVENIPHEYAYGYSYYRNTSLNLLVKQDDNIKHFTSAELSIASLPVSYEDDTSLLEIYYDLLAGHLPSNSNEILVIVDANNGIDETILKSLGYNARNISFQDILNTNVHLVLNDDYYVKKGEVFIANPDLKTLYNNKSQELKIVGIIRMKEDYPSYASSSGLAVTEELMQYVINNNSQSEIVKAQQKTNINLLTGMEFSENISENMSVIMTKEDVLSYFGDNIVPTMIYVYPKDFETKDNLINYLDEYNEDLSDEDKIVYIDQASLISQMSGNIMSAITYVLIAFSSVSLIVSSIMIGVITYISVLERTKEIGILRALGARKKDISRVFNAETFIVGITSGIIGVLIARLLLFPINAIIYKLTELDTVAVMNPIHAIVLIIISTLLTMIGGLIPAHMASKKDPVISLRSE